MLELYVQLFVLLEKMYRKTTGNAEPEVPEHLRDWTEE